MTEQLTVRIHKLIGGKMYPLELHRKRFEQTMDRIDYAVDKGATITDIRRKFADHIVGSGTSVVKADKPAVASTQPAGNKQEIVQAVIREFPGFSVGDVAKKVSAQGHMTYANARYIATKLMKK